MTTINEHLKKFRPKAHRTQKKNGQYLKMTISRLSKTLAERNKRIEEMETDLKWYKDELKLHERVEKELRIEVEALTP